MSMSESERDQIISLLITQDFLNEERFAIQFAGGKFRMKNWGKNRIIMELKARKVSEYCIQKAMNAINESDYKNTFFKLAEKKRLSLKSEKNIFIKKRKIKDYLLAKGFSPNDIYPYLAKI